jgi:uncharacterized phage protein (TIGR01671 family)
MRELKFRAWDVQRRTMELISDFYWFEENGVHGADGTGLYGQFALMQYTGLKDKNGKDIYEGDILTDPYGPEGAATGTVENINGDTVIKFIPGTIPEDWAHEYYPVFGGSGEYTVIGNIYENPELLKAI